MTVRVYRPQQMVHQHQVYHRCFVHDYEINLQRIVFASLKPASRGLFFSNRWIVIASSPALSVIRFAARPVGAAKTNDTLARRRIVSSAVKRVVLPVPGPPVRTRTF